MLVSDPMASDVADGLQRAPSNPFWVLGAGGLGCPALLGLAAAGAREITVFDDDRVDATNLQRQVLFAHADVGADKVAAAAHTLRGRGLTVHAKRRRLTPQGLEELLRDAPKDTILLDCSDDPTLKFAVNDLCLRANLGAVICGVSKWQGQIMAVSRGATCYRCLFEAPPPRELAPPCSAVGIVGPAAGVFGYWMAALAVRLATAMPDERMSIAGKLHVCSLINMTIQKLSPPPRAGCRACAGHVPALLEPPTACRTAVKH